MVKTSVTAKPETVRLLKNAEHRMTWVYLDCSLFVIRLRELACDISSQSPTNDGFLVLFGPIGGVLAARKLIIVGSREIIVIRNLAAGSVTSYSELRRPLREGSLGLGSGQQSQHNNYAEKTGSEQYGS